MVQNLMIWFSAIFAIYQIPFPIELNCTLLLYAIAITFDRLWMFIFFCSNCQVEPTKTRELWVWPFFYIYNTHGGVDVAVVVINHKMNNYVNMVSIIGSTSTDGTCLHTIEMEWILITTYIFIIIIIMVL